MNSAGYTFIELLVVISIISILSVVGFVSFKGFSEDQVTDKAIGQIQTLLRLAQSNATSSTLCRQTDGTLVGGVPWSLEFRPDQSAIYLGCGPTSIVQKTYTLENATFSISGVSDCSIDLPATFKYSPGLGALSLTASDATATCLNSQTITFTISNTINPAASPRAFGISKGGAIDVE